MKLTKKYFDAISNNDKNYDDLFFYGVLTTKIFCRPSCKSRTPKYKNIVIFNDKKEATHLGFRPCKRCRPLGEAVPNKLWIETVKNYIEKYFNEKLALKKIAFKMHGSPYHLFRVFKESIHTYQTKLS